MMTSEHDNARWLSDQYRGAHAISTDPNLDAAAREQKLAEHMRVMFSRLAPSWIIHTGGNRLAAVGDLMFAALYNRRRMALTGGTFRPVEFDEIVADDHYGIVRGTFRAERAGGVFQYAGMGVWRFVDGRAVEHWENPPGDAWDRFFLDADPTFTDGTAEAFWTKDS